MNKAAAVPAFGRSSGARYIGLICYLVYDGPLAATPLQNQQTMNDPKVSLRSPIVDFPELLVRVDHDRELLRDLINIFLEEFPKLVGDLRQAIAINNLKQVTTASHTLKGMLGNLAVPRATAAAAEIEQNVVTNDIAAIQQSLAAFELETSGLMQEMKAYLAEEPAE